MELEQAVEGKGVLVIDDDLATRQLFGTVLERQGFDVHLAANGRVAVEQIRSDPHDYSLVLMDHYMPEMDGLTACRALRKYLPTTPIVLMSSAELRTLALEAGADAFLSKPFPLGDLIACVSEYVPELEL